MQIENANNEIISFGFDKFCNEVLSNEICFICGVKLTKINRTKEHIIPQWLIKLAKINNYNVTLPNLSQKKYNTYTIPCCQLCNNNILSKEIETPIKELFDKDFNQFSQLMSDINNQRKVYLWSCLIFIKSILKDSSDKYELDKRKNNPKTVLEELEYNISDMHHNLEVARSLYVETIVKKLKIDDLVFGSFYYFPIKQYTSTELFDYIVLPHAQLVAFCINEIGFITVLDDSTKCLHFLGNLLKSLPNKLDNIQFRELVAHFATANLQLQNKPQGYTEYNKINNSVFLSKKVENPAEIDERDELLFGKILSYLLREPLNNKTLEHSDGSKITEEILLKGKTTFFHECSSTT
jgi:hypothetical protein